MQIQAVTFSVSSQFDVIRESLPARCICQAHQGSWLGWLLSFSLPWYAEHAGQGQNPSWQQASLGQQQG